MAALMEESVDAFTEQQDEQNSLASYLQPGVYVDSGHPDVVAFMDEAIGDAQTAKDQAIALYYAVRDRIRYDPYVPVADPQLYYASHCIQQGRGFCISKASVLTAVTRAAGIPSRIAFADVKNHLCTPRLRELMKTDVFTHHGFTELFIGGKWVQVTPTFNIELCERFGVMALDFDGENDALLHPFDTEGRRHMEYTQKHGAFADVPAERLRDAMLATYGDDVCERLMEAGDFAAEARALRSGN